LLRLSAIEQLAHDVFGHGHWQESVLVAVVAEDVGETRRDDGAKPGLLERPGRVFARRTGAEVPPTHQHACALILRLVQHEVRIGRAVRPEAPVEEQPGLEASPSDALQVLIDTGLIGYDVVAIARL